MNKFRPMKTRFRATFSGNQLGTKRLGTIDTENEILHDVQITLEGEALGHGIWLDAEFCKQVADAGNATGDVGLKVRYGHPSMCSDALGTELGRAKNFRVVEVEREIEGKKVKCSGVIADVHLLKSAHESPNGDLAGHVLAVAAEDPKQFGQSIVFTYSDFVVKDADGNRHSYHEECEVGEIYTNDKGEEAHRCKSWDEWMSQSADGKLYAVLGKLHGSDFTDTPAATDGIFSTNTLAEEAEQMLDEHPQILEVFEKSPKSVVEFLARTGLDKKIESARLAGLQSAKDQEIAALNARIAELTALDAGKLAAQVEELTAKNADLSKKSTEALAAVNDELTKAREELENLKSVHQKSEEALAKANAEVEQLTTDLGATRKDLAETREHLEEWKSHASEHGASVNTPPGVKAATWTEKYRGMKQSRKPATKK